MAKQLRDEVADQFGGAINSEALARYVERVEVLHEQRAELGEDIKAVMEEAKNAGFVPKIIRQMIRERGMEPTELRDHLALLESYRSSLGLLADTPLGEAAMRAAEVRSKPAPFADQPVHPAKARGRPRKAAGDAMAAARAHFGDLADDDLPLGNA